MNIWKSGDKTEKTQVNSVQEKKSKLESCTRNVGEGERQNKAATDGDGQKNAQANIGRNNKRPQHWSQGELRTALERGKARSQ
jgi:hypothetical protein